MGDELYQSRAWLQLHAHDPAVRRDAIREVLAIVRARPLAVPEVARDAMLLALGDGDEAVRCAAVRVLAVLGPAEVLVTAMQSPEPRTRRTALEVLQRHDVERSTALRAAVQAASSDPDLAVARRALELTGTTGLLDEAAGRAQIVAMLRHDSQRVRAAALHACSGVRLDVTHADVIRGVRRALRPRGTRQLAYRILANVEPRAVSDGLLNDLAAGLTARERDDRRMAVSTLSTLGRSARRVLPAVAAAHRRISGGDHEACHERSLLAAMAVWLGGADAWVVEELARSLGGVGYGYDGMASAALAMLAWLGPAAAAAEPALAAYVTMLEQYDESMHHDAVATLVAIAPDATRTHELRARFVTRAPARATALAARTAAFVPDPERTARILAWAATTEHYAIDTIADLALDELEAAPDPAVISALQQLTWRDELVHARARLERIAVRGALRRYVSSDTS